MGLFDTLIITKKEKEQASFEIIQKQEEDQSEENHLVFSSGDSNTNICNASLCKQ